MPFLFQPNFWNFHRHWGVKNVFITIMTCWYFSPSAHQNCWKKKILFDAYFSKLSVIFSDFFQFFSIFSTFFSTFSKFFSQFLRYFLSFEKPFSYSKLNLFYYSIFFHYYLSTGLTFKSSLEKKGKKKTDFLRCKIVTKMV